MKRILPKIYLSFLLLLLINTLFSVIFKYYLKDEVYYNYFPKEIIIPQYDLINNEVTNRDKVNFWSALDYAPWYGVVSYKIYRFTKINGILFYLLALLLLIPILVLGWRGISRIYWILVAFIFITNFILLGVLIT